MDAGQDLESLFAHNRAWAASHRDADPEFFKKLARAQVPDFLWIGCSDSRVPANEIIGLLPGEVFVHRNIANLVSLTDFNCLSVVQYAVQVLKVRHLIVCGHYGCGGVETAIAGKDLGIVTNWLSPISDIYSANKNRLAGLPSPESVSDKVCELNVIAQIRTLSRSAMLKNAWAAGQQVALHGLIYGLEDGILHDIDATVTCDGKSEALCHEAAERILSTPGRVVG